MTGKTHIIGGICAGLIFSKIVSASIGDTIVCVSLAANAALFPDIDTETSAISKCVGPFSKPFQLAGHRTIFHSPLLYIVLWYIVARYTQFNQMWLNAVLCGILSHLLLDMNNKKGIPLLFPLPMRFHFLSLRNNGKGEKVVLAFCKAISFCIVLQSIAN